MILPTMLVIQCSLNVINGSIWHSTAFENIKPFLCCFCFCDFFDHTVELDAIFDSVAVLYKAVIHLPLGVAKSVTEHTKESIVTATEENIPVEGLVAPIWDN